MRSSKTFKKIFPRQDSGLKTPEESEGFVFTKDYSTHSSDEKEALLIDSNRFKKASMFFSGKMSIREISPVNNRRNKISEEFPDMIKKTLRRENQKQFIKEYVKIIERGEYYESLRQLCKRFNVQEEEKEKLVEKMNEAQQLKDIYYNKKGGLLWRSDNYILTSNSICTKKGEAIYFGRGNFLVKWNTGLRKRDLAFEQNQWGKGHKEAITAVAVTNDGHQLVSGSKEGTLIVWDLTPRPNSNNYEISSPDSKNGTSDIRVLPSSDDFPVTSAIFSPDGKKVIFSRRNSVLSWNFDDANPKTTEYIHKDRVNSAAYSRNHYLASGGDDMVLRIWNDQNDKLKDSYKMNEKVLNCQKLLGHTGKILAVRFSIDGNSLLSCSEDKMIKLWEFEQNKFASKGDFEGHNRAVTAIEFSPISSREFVSGSADYSVILWNISSRSKVKVFVGHHSPIVSVAFSLDGSKVLSASNDNVLRLWNVTLSYKPITFESLNTEINQTIISHDGSALFLLCEDNVIRMYPMENDQKKTDDAIIYKCANDDPNSFSNSFSLTTMSLTTDGLDIIAGSEQGKLIMWNRESKKSKVSYQSHKGAIYFIKNSPDESKILTGGRDSLLKLWTSDDLTEILSFARPGTEKSEVLAADFSPDGCKVISSYSDNVLLLWDLISGQSSWKQEKVESVNSVIFFRNGNKIVSGGNDTLVYIWILESAEPIAFKTFKGHSGPVTCLSILEDDSRVISGSSDNTLNLWDIQTGVKISTFLGTQTESTLSVSPLMALRWRLISITFI